MSGTASSVPPAPTLAVEIGNNGTILTGTVLTDSPVPTFTGTDTPGDGSIELEANGSQLGPTLPASGSTFTGNTIVPVGSETITAVQTNSGGTSTPSNAISLYVASFQGFGFAFVNMSYAQFSSALANGLHVDFLYSSTVQLTDGEFNVASGDFTPIGGSVGALSANSVPPPPTLGAQLGNGSLADKVITAQTVLPVAGTATIADGPVTIMSGDGSTPAMSSGSSFQTGAFTPQGLSAVSAVQTNVAGTSAPSNTVTVDDIGTGNPTNGIATTNIDDATLQSLLSQGFQLDVLSARILQLTDGQYNISAGAFTPTGSTPVGNPSLPTAPPGANTVNASGGDTINLSGSTLVNVIAGANTINASGGADTIFAGTGSTQTTVNQSGSATILFQGGNAPSAAVEIVAQGTGGATIVGGANNLLVYSNAGTGTGAVFLAGNGNETLFDALSRSNDALWASFSGGSDLMFAGSGSDALVAGGGAQTLVGGAGTDTFYLINPSLVASITGTAEPPGHYTVFNAHPGDTIALTGYDSLYGAAGSHAAAASVAASLAGGGSSITLKDGSTISFMSGTQGVHVISS